MYAGLGAPLAVKVAGGIFFVVNAFLHIFKYLHKQLLPLPLFFSIICAHELFKGFERRFSNWAWILCCVLLVWHCGVEFLVVAARDAHFHDEPHVGGAVRGAPNYGG